MKTLAWNFYQQLRTLRASACGKEMTPDESRKLKPGTRVCYNGDPADRGTVTATKSPYVTIRWDNSHRSLTGHENMQRVELAVPVSLKSR